MIRRALGILVLVGLQASISQAAALYTGGHADLSVQFADGKLELGINALGAVIDGVATSAFLDPSDALVYVPESTVEPRPDNIPGLLDYDPLGIPAGTDFYRIPASGTEALILQSPFFGFGTYLLDPSEFVGDVTFQLIGFTGPDGGNFALYQDSFPGPTFLLTTADGIDSSDSFTLPVGAHDHYNFAFTLPGVYGLDIQVTATSKTLGTLTAIAHLSSGVTTSVPEVSPWMLIGTAIVGLLIAGKSRRWARLFAAYRR